MAGLNDEDLRQYFPLDNVLNEIFQVVEDRFSLKCVKVDDTIGWANDLKMYEIMKGQKIIGYLYLDLLPRPGKKIFTTTHSIVPNCRFPYSSKQYQLPIVSIVASFPPSENGTSSLLYHSNVIYLLREIGHSIHLLMGKSKFSILAGLNIESDISNVSGKIFENFAWDENILKRISCHYIKKTSLSTSSINKLIQTRYIGKGFWTKQMVLFSLFEHLVHTSNDFIDKAKHILEIDDIVLRKKRASQFLIFTYRGLHDQIFNSSGSKFVVKYSPNILPTAIASLWENRDNLLYSYLLSEVYSQDLYNHIFTNKEETNKFIEMFLCKGGTEDGLVMIRNVLGRLPSLRYYFPRKSKKSKKKKNKYQNKNIRKEKKNKITMDDTDAYVTENTESLKRYSQIFQSGQNSS